VDGSQKVESASTRPRRSRRKAKAGRGQDDAGSSRHGEHRVRSLEREARVSKTRHDPSEARTVPTPPTADGERRSRSPRLFTETPTWRPCELTEARPFAIETRETAPGTPERGVHVGGRHHRVTVPDFAWIVPPPPESSRPDGNLISVGEGHLHRLSATPCATRASAENDAPGQLAEARWVRNGQPSRDNRRLLREMQRRLQPRCPPIRLRVQAQSIVGGEEHHGQHGERDHETAHDLRDHGECVGDQANRDAIEVRHVVRRPPAPGRRGTDASSTERASCAYSMFRASSTVRSRGLPGDPGERAPAESLHREDSRAAVHPWRPV